MSEATVLRYARLADRQSTLAVWIGHPNAGSVLIGYVRLDDQIRWVARKLGSASQAADMRRSRPLRGIGLAAKGGGWSLCPAPEGRGISITIFRRSRATIVPPSLCIRQGVHRLPTGPFGTQPTPPADRCHVRIGTVRVGPIERGS